MAMSGPNLLKLTVFPPIPVIRRIKHLGERIDLIDFACGAEEAVTSHPGCDKGRAHAVIGIDHPGHNGK